MAYEKHANRIARIEKLHERTDDPVFSAEVEPDDSTHVIWSHTPPNSTWLPCRLSQDAETHASHLARHEGSRLQSPFNQRLYARRNRPNEMVVLLGSTRFSKTVEGVVSRDLSPDEVCEALRRDIGNPTGDLQVAANGAGADSSRHALVSSVLTFVPRCRRAAHRFCKRSMVNDQAI